METKDMLKEVLRIYDGTLGQLLTNLASEKGEEVFTELKKFNRGEPCYATTNLNLKSKKNSILRCISGGSNLSLESLDGRHLIYNAKDTFKSGIDNNFVNWGMNNSGIATPETLVQVHEKIRDSKSMGIFKALPGNWNQKWLSQNQVIKFCETLSDWLGRGKATMFLVKKDENKPIEEKNPWDNSVVVGVYVNLYDLRVVVGRLVNDYVWYGEDRHRVVSPQLIPSIV